MAKKIKLTEIVPIYKIYLTIVDHSFASLQSCIYMRDIIWFSDTPTSRITLSIVEEPHPLPLYEIPEDAELGKKAKP